MIALISVRMVLRTNIPAKIDDNLKSSRITATMPNREKALEMTDRMTKTTIIRVCEMGKNVVH